jgi:ABC-type Fe3+/spermidine/putrescine transport system ATPase subunit
MRHELLQLHKETGITMIYVTHDQGEALALGTRIAILNQGRIEQLATPQTLVESPATPFVRDFLGELSIVRGSYQQQGDKVQIAVTAGTIPCPGPVSKSDSTFAAVAIRPEGVIIIRQ